MAPSYLMTVCYMLRDEIQKEVIALPFVPNPGHTIKLHGWTYKVLEVTVEVYTCKILIDMEEV